MVRTTKTPIQLSNADVMADSAEQYKETNRCLAICGLSGKKRSTRFAGNEIC
jgi:hypothetical protein